MNKYLVILSFLVFINNSKAQTNIKINGVIHADTIGYGSLLYLDYWIVNNGTEVFNDNVGIRMGITPDTNLPIQISLSLATISESIEPGDSIPFTSIISVSTQLFQQAGDNLVVIWPSSVVPILPDSSFTPIHIIDQVSSIIEQNHLIKPLKLRLFDLLGREYQSLSDLPNGAIYIRDGKKYIKLID
jgi:hypothetical protein